MAFGEFIPYRNYQLNTYIGCGIGVNVSNIFWEETVKRELPYDSRMGGVHYDGTEFSFIGKIALGLDLGFDEKWKGYILGSLTLETSYIFDTRSIPIFTKINKQFFKEDPELNKSYYVTPGYIGFNVIVTFNFSTSDRKFKTI